MIYLFSFVQFALAAWITWEVAVPKKEEREAEARKDARYMEDIRILRQTGWTDSRQEVLRFHLKERGDRYYRDDWVPFTESPLSHFLEHDERKVIQALLHEKGEPEAMTEWVVRDFELFDELYQHKEQIHRVARVAKSREHTIGEKFLVSSDAFNRMEPLIGHIHESCEPSPRTKKTGEGVGAQ